MKRSLSIAAALLVVVAGGAAWALDSATVNVTAQVTGTCRFNTTSVDLAFGTLDQTSSADATATGNLSFWCTSGTGYNLRDPLDGDGTHPSMLTSGGNSMAYNLTYTNFAGSGAGKTTPITSLLTATIVNSVYVNAPAGNYSDSLIFTINP